MALSVAGTVGHHHTFTSMQPTLIKAALILLALWLLPAAAGDLGASAALQSDTVFRGLDQTNGLGAAAGVDARLDTRAGTSPYLGALALNNSMAGGSEIDIYGGASRTVLFHDLYPYTIDAGFIGYLFPQDQDGLRHHNLDAAEVYGGITSGPASMKLWLSPDYFGSGVPGGYLRGRLRWPIASGLALIGTGGIAVGPGVRRYTAALTTDRRGSSYADAEAAIEYDWRYGLVLRAAVTATTLDLGEQATGGHDRLRWVLGLRKDFDLGGF
jgi:uncharacterized protein (TIGR02001 family)